MSGVGTRFVGKAMGRYLGVITEEDGKYELDIKLETAYGMLY